MHSLTHTHTHSHTHTHTHTLTHTHTHTHTHILPHTLTQIYFHTPLRDGQAMVSNSFDENLSDDEDQMMKGKGGKLTSEAK